MPTLRILTNAQVLPGDRPGLLTQASRAVAEMLGKPESYVMVILEGGRDMLFAGTPSLAAYLELNSLGLAETKAAGYSRTLCDLLAAALGIPAERVYIEFSAPPAHLSGWNGGTF
jgi:phenylpyruvate tautomerase